MGLWSKMQAIRERRVEDTPARRNRSEGRECFYCGAPFEEVGPQQRTIDHRLPRSQRGSSRLVNLVFACRACNERKASRPEAEFVQSAWLDERRRRFSPDR